MNMKNMKTYAEKIQSLAAKHGSTATTIRGAAKFLAAKKPANLFYPPVVLATADGYRLHDLLDHGRVGDVAAMTRQVVPGFGRAAFADPATAGKSLEYWGACNPRKKNIYTGDPRVSGNYLQDRWETIKYKGSFRKYTGSEVYCDYQSCVAVSRSGRSAVWVLGNRIHRRWIAPVGLQFGLDKNLQIVLIRKSDGMDYHPTGEDLRAKNWIGRCRAAMAKNYIARQAAKKLERENARFAKIKAREIGSVRVTMQDSRRAGNCVEGAIRFAESRLGISREQIANGAHLLTVSAAKLLATNDTRAKSAVEMAWARETMVQI